MLEQNHQSISTDNTGLFDIHNTIRLLDQFMSAGGWRTERSAINYLVEVWTQQLDDIQTEVYDSIPDGLTATLYVDERYLEWQGMMGWKVWFTIRSYGDALKWQEGGRLSGKIDPLLKRASRYNQYRLDTRFPVEPNTPAGVPVPTVDELQAMVRAANPRPLSGQKRAGRPKKLKEDSGWWLRQGAEG